jgi:saccharopine dehydrogenase-like NADP-dependent oxidoreductase
LGAAGHVARAFLRRLGGRRECLSNLVLVDRNRRLLHDPVLEHRRLSYVFTHRRLRLPEDEGWYRRLLRRYDIDIVVDLSDMDTLPVFTATDAAGVSYVNTSLNDSRQPVSDLMEEVRAYGGERTRAPHILCSGMNPGVVNIWVRHGVEQFGVPREIVHFEYDTSAPVSGWRPIVTWSRKEFLAETAWDPTGFVRDGEPQHLADPAVVRLVDMSPILKPALKLPAYPKGFLVLHEENLTLGARWGVSSRFLYALHPATMKHLCRTHRTRGRVREADLVLGDNNTLQLEGADTIGVCLEYPRRRVYYLHSLPNAAVVGTSATCAQVALGVYAALLTLLHDSLPRRLHFVGDLFNSLYRQVIFANMRVERSVFARRRRGWKRLEYTPQVRARPRDGLEDFVV